MDQSTINTYNRLAKEYDEETIDFWEQFPRTFLDRFITMVGARILDVGSGPGRDGLLLQRAGKEVTCLDASEAMVALSRERGLNSIQASFDELPFEDASFDGVWSYTALLHSPKHALERPLSEIARVLKPAGIFALGLIEGEGELYRTSPEVALPRWFSYFQKSEVVELCHTHGFALEYFDTFTPRSKNYPNFIFRKTVP